MSDDCSWRKVYEHRADGTRFSGDLDDLVDAVKAGADVQIRYFFSTPFPMQGEWRRTCSSVTYVEHEDEGGPIVSCLITDIPDTQADLTRGRTFAEPFAVEWQAYNTSGTRHVVKFNHRTRDVESDSIDNRQIAWYVRGVAS
jgi:hypothetical protein